MRYETHKTAERLREAREARGVSQHELSTLAGVPQAQISRIEAGAVDPRISSLVALAHALDQELVLVPRKMLSAVQSLVRQSPEVNSRAIRAANKELARTGEALRTLQIAQSGLKDISQLQRQYAELAGFRNVVIETEKLRKIRKLLERAQKPGYQLEALTKAMQAMTDLRKSVVHATGDRRDSRTPRPAYTLDGGDDG